MKKNHWLFFLLWLAAFHTGAVPVDSRSINSPIAPAASIAYTLSMPQPQTHYFDVAMRLKDIGSVTNNAKTGYLDVKMPVWTPGSYLIREYAKNVEGFAATVNGQPVPSEKIKKNTWRIYTKAESVTLTYKVYAFELSVRTSFLDASHGYLNGASIFMYVDPLRSQPHRVTIQPYKDWKTISTGLPAVAQTPNTFEAADYDILVDSPIEIGNHHTFTFTAAGIPHTVAMYGDPIYNERQLAADMKKVCETATTVIGEHPCRDYTFIVHQTPNGGGGLEHLNSTTLQTTRNAFLTAKGYQDFLSLVAHEYFHLWNVKRIRPKALGPFDYEAENYTHLLWVSEGITSFYQTHLLRRAGFMTPDAYLKSLADEISGIENQPGNRVQSVAESSWDAWIKYYRPNENSVNSVISYYDKGSVLGSLLNLSILSNTAGRRSLDDVLRLLYDTYYKKQRRGFTDQEFEQAVEQVAGRSLAPFFRNYVFGTAEIDYNSFFNPVGLKLVDASASKQDSYLGILTRTTDGKLTVSAVRRNSAAWNDGLNVNDELIAIDNIRLANDLDKRLATYRPGERMEVLVNRGGSLRKIPVQLTGNPLAAYRLEPLPDITAEQRALLTKWLYLN